eukprot:4481163-Prorocentrum_lima.AAC.1
MLKAASDMVCRSALWECQRVRSRGVRVASNVHLLYSCFGLSSPARLSCCSANCWQSNARTVGSAS